MEGSIAYMRMKHGSSSMEYPLLYTHTQDAAVALNISSSQQVGDPLKWFWNWKRNLNMDFVTNLFLLLENTNWLRCLKLELKVANNLYAS